jgi:trk system potassium uptake protein TrkH|tara:strand:+ start:46559 stop:48106 length:1548 start_codon:yes stop_codon:yes gene_type:complete
MNISQSLKFISIFVRYFSFFLLVPIFSVFFINLDLSQLKSESFYIKSIPFFCSSLVSYLFSILLLFISKSYKSENEELGRKDGFLIATFVWIFAGALGSLPYIFSSTLIPMLYPEIEPIFYDDLIVNSFFESVSGITTTGASVFSIFPNIEQHSMIIFWRSLSQWLGGIGIILLVLIIFPRISVGIMQIASDQEGTGPQKERITPRLYQTGLTLLIIYLGISLLLYLLLFFVGGLSSYDSVIHSFSTVSSGGFSSYPLSIESLQNFKVEIIILIFMFVSGISFAIFYYLITANFQRVFDNSEFKTYVIFNLFFVIALVFLLNDYYGSLSESLRYGTFQAISISTGTGFTTYNFSEWPSHIKFFLLLFLIIGGSSGSTTGGIKMIRVIIVFKRIYLEIRRRVSPNIVYTVKINNKSIDDEVVSGVMSFLFLFIMICIISILFINILEPNITAYTAASAVMSSITNLGPGFEGINPHSNYALFSTSSKIWLSFLMMLGRLEIFTMVALLLPSFWKKY